jgi:hypothetical protein
MSEPPGLVWTRDGVAGVALDRHVGRAGALEEGTVMYDGSNRMWVWSSPLSDEAWGYGTSEAAAKRGFEAWLRQWLLNFRGLLDRPAE